MKGNFCSKSFAEVLGGPACSELLSKLKAWTKEAASRRQGCSARRMAGQQPSMAPEQAALGCGSDALVSHTWQQSQLSRLCR